MTAPIRVNDVAKPVAELRISVGNSPFERRDEQWPTLVAGGVVSHQPRLVEAARRHDGFAAAELTERSLIEATHRIRVALESAPGE